MGGTNRVAGLSGLGLGFAAAIAIVIILAVVLTIVTGRPGPNL